MSDPMNALQAAVAKANAAGDELHPDHLQAVYQAADDVVSSTSNGRLVLHIEVPGIDVSGLGEYVASVMDGDPMTPRDTAQIMTNEWLREQVGITLVTRPGDLSENDDFEVCGLPGTIIGMEFRAGAAS